MMDVVMFALGALTALVLCGGWCWVRCSPASCTGSWVAAPVGCRRLVHDRTFPQVIYPRGRPGWALGRGLVAGVWTPRGPVGRSCNPFADRSKL